MMKIEPKMSEKWRYEPSNVSTIKKLEENILIPENCEEICVPKLNREIFFSKYFQHWVKMGWQADP